MFLGPKPAMLSQIFSDYISIWLFMWERSVSFAEKFCKQQPPNFSSHRAKSINYLKNSRGLLFNKLHLHFLKKSSQGFHFTEQICILQLSPT